MLVGEIIKFYREKKRMSQSELGEGICSKGYISRFEKGNVTFSPEIISTFSKRLEIDINHEIETLNRIDVLLQLWNQSMIMQNSKQIEEIKLEVEKVTMIPSSKYASFYLLLKARYFLHKKMFNDTKSIIEALEKGIDDLTNFEKNFLKHIKGMYYLSTYTATGFEDFHIAIKILKQIDFTEYKNKEAYYHIALGYHFAGLKINAYSFAVKALDYFNDTDNYIHAINTQTLMLVQIEDENHVCLTELIEKYNHLIHNCETLGVTEKKLILLNNLGGVFFKRGEYKEAAKYFEQSLLFTERSSIYYLRRYYNLLETCSEGMLSSNAFLLEEINKVLKLAKQHKSSLHFTLCKLLSLKCKKNLSQYYDYLEEVAIPHFKSTNHRFYLEMYGKKLLNHYIEMGQFKKAVEFDLYINLKNSI